MADRVRVLVYYRCDDEATIRAAYDVVSPRLSHVPGLLRNELLASTHDPSGYIVLSEWSDLETHRRWEQSQEHREQTAPLQPYLDDRLPMSFGIYEVKASY
ncbi:antibiotic biosynthesis monooxygenase [Saccharomonospora sp.]|uniref:antibiotic biosynthesis monooxygenase family protein n=1 Tax=Saccharomonospora sp. TaxID=33913 RepID=UPI002612A1A3|nr:antibiotic biosynthesis monooxygenase [Saccharomonospora sp.]